MASNAKRKTTMAKLNRERRLRERRAEKQAKKEARRQASADGTGSPGDVEIADESIEPRTAEDALGPGSSAATDPDRQPPGGTDRDEV
jgi:hypothetical protein